MNQEVRSHQISNPNTLFLDFPASRIVKNNFCFLHITHSMAFCYSSFNELRSHVFVNLFLGFLFFPISLYVCFQYQTVLVTAALWYTLKSESVISHAFSFSGLLWLFWVFCGSIWILELFFSLSVKTLRFWDSDRCCTESVDHFG